MIKIEDECGEPLAGISRKPFTINIIGDIGGRYDELMLLLKKMPEAAKGRVPWNKGLKTK